MGEVEARRYRILGVLGKGGFGKVYRASLEGPEGFYKDVAIKLMRDEDVPESTLQRFRDEARILGLVRDRAIVTVDPPTRLGGRWAVVMEYVDGVSCGKLLKAQPFPPGVALEIVEEMARALDKVFHQQGRDGESLQLLHRDIKPGNIQITPSGEVKILDFGIARARFADREAETTRHIGGTFGYIAPERLSGAEGPEGDIYSLGVVLHVLCTGDKPTRPGEFQPHRHNVDRNDPELQQALRLAKQMMHTDPEKRPTARQVEDLASVVRRNMSGRSLRRWAEDVVPEAVTMAADDLCRSILTETLANVPRTAELLERVRELDAAEAASTHTVGVRATPYVAVSVAVAMAALGALLSFFAVRAYLFADPEEVATSVRPEATIQANVTPPPAPAPAVKAPEPKPEVATSSAPPSAPAPAKVQPAAAKTAPKPAPASPTPAPVAAPPAPEPAPAVETAATPETAVPTMSLRFGSLPLGAQVFVDGELIGKTPKTNDVVLKYGAHRVRMVSASGASIERDIEIGRRKPIGYVWYEKDSRWDPQY